MNFTYLISLLVFFFFFANSTSTVAQVGDGSGPSEDEPAFAQANMSPNATGVVNLKAYNMSADSNTAQEVLWKAHLNVTEVTNLNYTQAKADVITNSVIAIDTLGNWVEDSPWTTAIFIIGILDRDEIVDGQKDTGDCSATLGATCVSDYLVSASQNVNTSAPNPEAPPTPASCENKIDEVFWSSFNANYTNGSAYFYSVSAAHNASNTTFYEKAVTQVWPILLVQNSGSTGIAVSSLSCLKANVTTAGSKAIGNVPSAATGASIHAWAVVGIVCLVELALL